MIILKMSQRTAGRILAADENHAKAILQVIERFSRYLLKKVYENGYKRPLILESNYLKIVTVQYLTSTRYYLAFMRTDLEPTIEIIHTVGSQENFLENFLISCELNIGPVVWGFEIDSLPFLNLDPLTFDGEIGKILTAI